MKCTNCRSCVTLIRVDYETSAEFYWYCPVCTKAYEMTGDKLEVTNPIIKTAIEDNYYKKYGHSIV